MDLSIMSTKVLKHSSSYWRILLCYILFIFIMFKICDLVYGFSLSDTLYLVIYIIVTWFLSVWITVYALEKLLQENKLMKLSSIFKPKGKVVKQKDVLDGKDMDNIILLSESVDQYYVQTWFEKISVDQKFSKENRAVLEEVIKSLIQVQFHIDNTHLLYGVGNVFLKHIKEYRRMLKRRGKLEETTVELYRYFHTSMVSNKAQKYFIHQMTSSLFNNYINWELWNSLPCQILISVISQKVALNLLNIYSSPHVLNYYLLKMFVSGKVSSDLKLNQYSYVKLTFPDEQCYNLKDHVAENLDSDENKNVEDKLLNANENESGQIVLDKEEAAVQISEKIVDKIHVSSENKVKIYEPKSANKTWRNSTDFTLLTMGEDPLTQDECDVTINTLWVDHSGEATVNTLHNIKDFQENTVNNVVKPVTNTALNKIGDLQDEAAGVVEGILDFGIAGIRKGLKLTGLQDNISDSTPVHGIKKIEQSKSSTGKRKLKNTVEVDLGEDTMWENMLHNDSLSSRDFEDIGSISNSNTPTIPSILMDPLENNGSPDLEYEETADLATTIAKLRSLLQQKSESSLSTPMVSPMPPDDVSGKDLLDSSDVDDVDGVVPSFYKFRTFCANTASGVFSNTLNTLKTALPANANENYLGYNKTWTYLESAEESTGLHSRMNKLLAERKAYCIVEPAFEAFDSLQYGADRSKDISQVHFRDELDELEGKFPLAKILVDIFCELVSNSDTIVVQEPLIKTILLLFGEPLDQIITEKFRHIMDNITGITKVPTSTNKETLNLDYNVFIQHLMSSLPDYVWYGIGRDTLKEAFSLFVLSLQTHKINQDILLQAFELVCLKFIEESSKLTPPNSA